MKCARRRKELTPAADRSVQVGPWKCAAETKSEPDDKCQDGQKGDHRDKIAGKNVSKLLNGSTFGLPLPHYFHDLIEPSNTLLAIMTFSMDGNHSHRVTSEDRDLHFDCPTSIDSAHKDWVATVFLDWLTLSGQ